jgi:hypothetical protein
MAPAFALVGDEPDEHQLQIQCTEMLRIVLLPNVAWTAIDHAHSLDRRLGRRGVPIGLLEARKRQRRGIRAGICDYLLWHHGAGFAIELKVGDNDLSPDQTLFVRQLLGAGVPVKVCWNRDQVFATVVSWRLTRPMRAAA